MSKNFNKQKWQKAFERVLQQPIGDILKNFEGNQSMMQHVYPGDKFLETLPWIEEHFGYERKDEVSKGVVFTLGVATLNQIFLDYLNEETA